MVEAPTQQIRPWLELARVGSTWLYLARTRLSSYCGKGALLGCPPDGDSSAPHVLLAGYKLDRT